MIVRYEERPKTNPTSGISQGTSDTEVRIVFVGVETVIYGCLLGQVSDSSVRAVSF